MLAASTTPGNYRLLDTLRVQQIVNNLPQIAGEETFVQPVGAGRNSAARETLDIG